MDKKIFIFLMSISLGYAQENSEKDIERSFSVILQDTSHGNIGTGRNWNYLQNLYFLSKYEILVSDYWDYDNHRYYLRSWDIKTGKNEYIYQFENEEYIRYMAASQDDEYIVVNTGVLKNSKKRPYIGLFRIRDRKWMWKIDAEDYDCAALWFIKDENKISVFGGGQIYLFDRETGTLLKKGKSFSSEYFNSNSVLRQICVSPDGHSFVIWQQPSSRGDNYLPWLSPKGSTIISVWDVLGDTALALMPRMGKGYTAASFTSDGGNIIFSSPDSIISFWSLKTKKIEKIAIGGANYIIASNKYCALGGRNALIFQYPSLEPSVFIKGFMNTYLSFSPMPFAFSKDDKFFAIELLGKLVLYETEKWKEIWHMWSRPNDALKFNK